MTKLITTALPYANGPLHLGHMVEQVQADIFARAMRLQHPDVVFLSGDDAHGVAIMLAASDQNYQSVENYINDIYNSHVSDLDAFRISYDIYGSTHSDQNRHISASIYNAIKNKDWLKIKPIKQPYDIHASKFLSDRFVRGVCPHCGAQDQYGDGCDQCGRAYEATDLIKPYNALSKSELEWRDTDHAFFELERARPAILDWMKSAKIQPAVYNKLQEWFTDELRHWDISRNAPYFGFPVPDLPEQYFYVWLDAPCAYLAILEQWLQENQLGNDWRSFWQEAHITQFVGKDILYHHGLFWPAMLAADGLKGPDELFSHGFLTISGQKMSKSRGTYYAVKEYLSLLPPDYLRYYIAAKLSDGVVDIDLDWDDFAKRINADLVGKLINLGSRLSRFVHKNMDGRLGVIGRYESILHHLLNKEETILAHFNEKQNQKAVKLIMELTDHVNQWVSEIKPWDLAKAGEQSHMAEVVTTGMNCYRWLMHMLAPICPSISSQALAQFKQMVGQNNATEMVIDVEINEFVSLGQRVVLDTSGHPVSML